jgi:hypothetical protein
MQLLPATRLAVSALILAEQSWVQLAILTIVRSASIDHCLLQNFALQVEALGRQFPQLYLHSQVDLGQELSSAKTRQRLPLSPV